MNAVLLLLLAAGADPKPPAHPPVQLPGKVIERNDVSWREWIVHEPNDSECGTPAVECGEDRVMVENLTPQTLRCHAAIKYAQPNEHAIVDAERSYLLLPGKTVPVVRSLSPGKVPVSSHDSECTAVPDLAPIRRPANCKLGTVEGVNPADYYPEQSRLQLHEGPVTLEFTVRQSPGELVDVFVVQSSLYMDLDAAALRMAADMRLSTNCPGQRFRVTAEFRLD